jgi:hypothetical protein
MTEAIAWLEEAAIRAQELDFHGQVPKPMPTLNDEEVLDLIKDFWAQGETLANTYAWMTLAQIPCNPFEVKRVFDRMDADLNEYYERAGI